MFLKDMNPIFVLVILLRSVICQPTIPKLKSVTNIHQFPISLCQR